MYGLMIRLLIQKISFKIKWVSKPIGDGTGLENR